MTGLCAQFGVQLPGQRKDTAALRIIGSDAGTSSSLPHLEALSVLGTAVAAGGVSGAVAQSVVTDGLTYGYADRTSTPRVLTSLDVTALTVLVLASLVVLMTASVVFGALTVRSAPAATLRGHDA